MNRKASSSMEKENHTRLPIQDQVWELQPATMASPHSSLSAHEVSRRKDREKVYGAVERQNILALSILMASICGCFNVLTLICSLTAVLASVRSSQATDRGDHRRARHLGNISIAFVALTILSGAITFIFLAAIVIGLAPLMGPCGFTLHECTKDMFGRPLQTMMCIRFPL